MEKADWKLLRSALDKSERKMFDDIYVSACANSIQLVPLQPIVMSILFHHYKDLKKRILVVERIETKANNKKRKWLIKKEEETQRGREEEISAITLDSYLLRITPVIDKIIPFFLYLGFLLYIC
jgi:hypothetical protein